MAVKDKLIGILEREKGSSVSGEQLAKELSVSRAAVWKAVHALQDEGYPIKAGKNRGYMLDSDSDIMSAEGIRLYLPKELQGMAIEVLPSVDSTNSYAKRRLAEGCFLHGDKSPKLFVANEQTAGRGRLGRSFISPKDGGIYMSLVFSSNENVSEFLPVTVAAAVAVTRVIERFSNEKPKIKWVNDIFIGNKKVCGILTEGISDFESGRLEAAIVGIGINVKSDISKFPEEVKDIAVSLNDLKAGRNRLIAEISAELIYLSENLKDPALMDEYRSKSLLLKKEICRKEDRKE